MQSGEESVPAHGEALLYGTAIRVISCGRKYIPGGEATQKHWVPGNTPDNTSAPNLCSHSRQRATQEDTVTSLESITTSSPGKGYRESQAL